MSLRFFLPKNALRDKVLPLSTQIDQYIIKANMSNRFGASQAKNGEKFRFATKLA